MVLITCCEHSQVDSLLLNSENKLGKKKRKRNRNADRGNKVQQLGQNENLNLVSDTEKDLETTFISYIKNI